MEAKVKVVAVNPRGSIHKHNRFGNQMRCLITGVAASNASPASSVLRPASLNGGLNANPSLIAGKQIAAPAVTTIIKTVRTVGEGTRIVPSDIEKRFHLFRQQRSLAASDIRAMNPEGAVQCVRYGY